MTQLVGRDDERRTVRGVVAAGAGDVGGVVLVSGEPGIGKSSLLADACEVAVDAGMVVRRATADERDGGRSHALLHALFPELADELHAIAASRPHDAMDFAVTSRLKTADAVVGHVEALRARTPMLLAVDDLQWADAESLFALGALVRRAGSLAVCVVAAFRTTPTPSELAQLIDLGRASGAAEVILGPLSAADAASLAEQHVEGALPASLRARLEGAAGNPWLITELAAHAHTSDPDSRAGLGRSGTVPPAVRDALRRRLRSVDDEVAAYLRAASVLGGTFSVEDLAALVDESVGRVAVAMTRGIDAGFLDDTGVGLRFRHDLLRQALESELPPSVARSLHREAANVLRAAGAPPTRVAPHLVVGARVGDTDAFDWLVDAADDAARLAPATAADLLGHAVELCHRDDPRRASTEVLRAQLLVWGGRPNDAEILTGQLLEIESRGEVADELRAIRARALFALGRAAEGDDQLRHGREDPDDLSIFDARHLAEAALLRLFAADIASADRFASAALAADPVDTVSESVAHSVLGWTSSLRGAAAAARFHADAALEIAAGSDSPQVQRFVPHLFAAVVQNAVGDTPGARLTLRSGRAVSARLDVGWHRAMYDWAEGVVAFMAGEWSDALALGEAGAVSAEESGLQLGALWHVAIAALVSTRRGEIETARAMLAEADELVARGPIQFGFDWYAWAHATVLFESGQADVAVTVLDGAWRVAERTGARSTWHVFGVDLAAGALDVGRLEVVDRVADGLAELAATSGLALHRGLAMHVAGLRDADAELLAAAADELEPVRRPFEHARAAGHAAVAFAARGDAEQARRSARRALGVYDALDAAASQARLREALRAHGIAVRGSTRPRATATGWDALTKSERAVVELVARGLSNGEIAERLFVSRRTVESHLVHVYAKVGARSRVELARQVAERSGG